VTCVFELPAFRKVFALANQIVYSLLREPTRRC
jgi:hypothetical protein